MVGESSSSTKHRPGKNKKEKRAESKQDRKKHKKRHHDSAAPMAVLGAQSAREVRSATSVGRAFASRKTKNFEWSKTKKYLGCDIARYCAILRDIRRYSAIIHDIQKISARAGIRRALRPERGERPGCSA